MKEFLLRLWKDEEGAETVEWIFIVVVILAVAAVSYAGGLADGISNAIADVVTGLSQAGANIVSGTGGG